MRKLILLACVCAVAATPAWAARGADPEAGSLSIERGKGTVTLDVRGNVLGRLTNGTITVTDKTPNDAYVATVTGRKYASSSAACRRRRSSCAAWGSGSGCSAAATGS